MTLLRTAAKITLPLILTATALPALAAGDAKNGEVLFAACKACHPFEKDQSRKIGPNLYHFLTTNEMGGASDYRYSEPFKQAMAKVGQWDDEELMKYLANPSAFLSGLLNDMVHSKMVYSVRMEEQRADLVAYLRSEQAKYK